MGTRARGVTRRSLRETVEGLITSEEFEVAVGEAGDRLDRLVSRRARISRSLARRAVEEGCVLVGGAESAPAYKVRVADHISIELPEDEGPQAEDIPVPVVYEDGHILVVDKPAGLLVHPGAGNPSGTLVNALLEKGISGGDDPVRPGVVHRLDRDTSGLLVLTKDKEAYSGLVSRLSAREVRREYRTVVVGVGLPPSGTVDSPVGRDPDNPTLMAVGVGKPAVTHFENSQEAGGYTMLRVRLETGRTHQIRVHLSAIGYPVYADPLYGKAVPDQRLWLHAERLAFRHPVTGELLEFESALPKELRESASRLGFR